MILSDKIKELRKKQSLRIRDVAAEIGVDSSLVSRFETGARKPTREQVALMERIFNVRENELLKLWIADSVLQDIKSYPFAGEVMKLVADAMAGYQKLLDTKTQQNLPLKLTGVLKKVDALKADIDKQKPLNQLQLKKLNEYFFTEYTFESNKIEGNTLTLQETAMVIKDGLTIGGKSVREHLEAINHHDAVEFINGIASGNEYLSERLIKEIHYLVLKGIEQKAAGKYREVEVRISGSKHEPPVFFDVPLKMQEMINYFHLHKNNLHPVILAADMHQILVGIHPFIDGNGRTSRLLMNLILLQNGYYIANIKGNNSSRLGYYKALEKAHTGNSLNDFRLLVANAVKDSLESFYKLVK